MVVGTICFDLDFVSPAFCAVRPGPAPVLVGWGAYQAVDWALALRVLPSRDLAGKDMGIWHIAFVLPLIIGPAATGWLVSTLRLFVSAGDAYMGAFTIATIWFVLAATLIGRVRLGSAK